ncbi:MAG TPA: UDP-N-acetylmuramoyl-L-alanine--D-glutamate ligase [Steroidobacteraceae bacterium]|jgi:UDP-N-acetylmuramoylalanine--D-glutamate ligase|nr:UDP-N-acetylmuramoyl-L-alanine--D-glutamate ligase [Steroidobacteraceae bacterium]
MSVTTPKATSAVIVGLGRTGLSCARYLRERGWRLAITDTRPQPPQLAALRELDPQIPVRLGGLDARLLDDALCVVVSPGVSLEDPFFAAARRRGLEIVGDIELFARAVDAPVAGITGTNGKSTVTTLLGRMAARAGVKVRVGGNLGEPALDLLGAAHRAGEGVELYVLELSSFQLEATHSLDLAAAAVLNVSPDHLDRYVSVEAYAEAKARIFARCDTAVINLDDPLVVAMPKPGQRTLSFSLRATIGADYAVAIRDGGSWLTCRGEPLLPVSAMRIRGLHNAANALAALALGEALGVPVPAMLAELETFTGLPHRTQWVAEVAGVTYIDDSKGTNVGATIAAVEGMEGPLVMIAGGDGKNQDFAPLAAAFRGKVRHTVLIGRDGPQVGEALRGHSSMEYCATLEEAVRAAAAAARAGDTVLLSPACASLDMFRDYTHRGAVFARAVRELAA